MDTTATSISFHSIRCVLLCSGRDYGCDLSFTSVPVTNVIHEIINFTFQARTMATITEQGQRDIQQAEFGTGRIRREVYYYYTSRYSEA